MASPFRVTGGLRGWKRLPPQVQENDLIALEILNRARREHRPIRDVVAEDGRISMATQMRYTRTATTRDAFGRITAKRADRLLRPMEVLDVHGDRVMRGVYGSRSASKIGAHQAAIGRFLETGD